MLSRMVTVHVVISGGAQGIGLATARAFAATGAMVTVGDIDLAAAKAAAAGMGGRALPLDVRDPDSFTAFLDAAGPVDVLVNNAGLVVPADFLETPARLRDLQIDVNLRGVVHGMAAALPAMVTRGSGHVINVSSLAGQLALPRAAMYTATKFAVVGLTEAVRAELRDSGVKVSAVLPTFVPTRMTEGLPLGRVPKVSADRVAAAIVRTARRGGPALVTVPRWLGLAPMLTAWTPQGIQDVIRGRAAHADLGTARERRDDYTRRIEDLLR
jgi:NADP-dependent 3-hydroxy acid dehydrogenase YdfG